MTPPLTLTSSRRPDGVVVLTAAGEIDLSNADALASALAGAAAADGTFVVDLTAVEYLDSAGLAALLPHVERVRIVAGELLAPVLTIAGLADITVVDGE